MADVIRIAKERRASLVAEIARLDSFVRMADVLVKYEQSLGHGLALGSDPTAATVLLADPACKVDSVPRAENSRVAVSVPNAVTASTDVDAKIALDAAANGTGIHNIPAQPDAALNGMGGHSGEQSITAFRTSPDHFSFNEKAPAGEDELVLDNPMADSTALVDVHVGQRMRQRRWMMGMTQQQLGDLVDVKFEQVQKFEAGAIHIGAGRMWDVAAAMEVPMSYFFEGIEGQVADTGEFRGSILTEKEAAVLMLGNAPQVRKARAS